MFRRFEDPGSTSVTIYIDDVPAAAQEGESIAAVLLRQPAIWARSSPISGQRRAPFCMMGVCFDCLAIVDGMFSVQTCLTPVRHGMRVERQCRRADGAR